jgi:surfeit locus 1 family protein
MLFVNAGWVGEEWKGAAKDRLSTLPQGDIMFGGLLRKADWSSFASPNSPEKDQWFRPDLAEIAKARNVPKYYPFLLYADQANPTLNGVELHETGWLPRNKHLQYALFWYALALAMAGVYALYYKGWRRKEAGHE